MTSFLEFRQTTVSALQVNSSFAFSSVSWYGEYFSLDLFIRQWKD